MAITAQAQGKTFTFPDGTSPEQMGLAIDEFFGRQKSAPSQPSGAEQFRQQQIQEQPLTIMEQRSQALGAAPQASTRPELTSSRPLELEKIREENPYLADLIQDMSPAEAAAVGFQQGLRTVGRGVGKIAGQDFFTEVNDPALKKLQASSPAAAIGKIAGEAAPFAAAAPLTGTVGTGLQLTRGGAQLVPQITSTAGRAAATGALGATEGGTIAAGQDRSAGEIAGATLLGGAFGAGAEVAIPLINRSARGILNKAGLKGQAFDKAGNLTDEAQEILKKSDINTDEFLTKAIDRSDIGDDARKAAFEKLGLTPTQAQVTRDKDLFSKQVEAFTNEGAVTAAIERQDKILKERAGAELSAIGGVPERVNESIFNAISDKAVLLDKEISDLYAAARLAAPDAKNVRFNATSQLLRGSARLNTLSGGVIEALAGEMEKMGVLKDFKPVGRISVDQAESLRQFSSKLFKSTNGLGREIIRDFKDSVDDDVAAVAGKDFFDKAREAKRNFEKGLSTTNKTKFGERDKSLVRDVLTEKVSSDKIADVALSRGSSYDSQSLSELRDYLLSGNEAQVTQGTRAWNDIKSKAMQNVLDDAFRGPVNRDGVQSLSRAGIESGIRKIGNDKFKVLFSVPEKEFILDLAKVAALREAPPGVRPSPSGPAIRELQKMLSNIPYLGGTVANDIINSLKNKANEKKVLQLVDQAKNISKQNNRIFEAKIRKTGVAQALPILAVPAAAAENKESER
jgi:hypothetical protein